MAFDCPRVCVCVCVRVQGKKKKRVTFIFAAEYNVAPYFLHSAQDRCQNTEAVCVCVCVWRITLDSMETPRITVTEEEEEEEEEVPPNDCQGREVPESEFRLHLRLGSPLSVSGRRWFVVDVKPTSMCRWSRRRLLPVDGQTERVRFEI